MSATYYPTSDDAYHLHVALMATLGAAIPALMNPGALESALHRPRQASHYEDADLATQAALLIGGIARAHAFEDGNKRAALMIGDVFLQKNNAWVVAEPFELADQLLALINRSDSEVEATSRFADWLRSRLRYVDETTPTQQLGTVYDIPVDLTVERWGVGPHAEFDGGTVFDRREALFELVRKSQESREPVSLSFSNFDVFNGAYLFIVAEPEPGMYILRAFARRSTRRPRPTEEAEGAG